MKLKNLSVAVIVVAIIFGGILVSKGFNLWYTESQRVPAKYQTGDFKGEYNPEDIRGSYSFGDIESNFGVKSEVIAWAFGINKENSELVKYKYIQESAYKLWIAEGKLDDKLKAELLPLVIKVEGSNVTISEKTEEHEETAIFEIKGKTTVQEVINMGVPLEVIEEILGIKIKNNNLSIRDIALDEGKSFSEVKAALQEHIDE